MIDSNANNVIDVAIIGQGLAGTALAWQLHMRGRSVLLIDRGDPFSASRIAAGLMTPITGQRLARFPNWEMFHLAAAKFYRSVEYVTAYEFYDETSMVRLFRSNDERKLFGKKYSGFGLEDLRICLPHLLPDPERVYAPWGGFEMLEGARLHTETYLSVSRRYFEQRGRYRTAELSLPQDIRLTDSIIEVPRLNVRCSQLVFCQGFAGVSNPWFCDVPFDAAKGEILTLKQQHDLDGRVLHGGLWIAPGPNRFCQIGATYDRERLDSSPTVAGRKDLLGRLQRVVPESRSWDVIGHRAAVRPIIHGRQPKIGFHPRDRRLGFFNGLGSRGALLSPWLAEHLADALCRPSTIDYRFDLNRKVDLSACFA
jgi:glycine/D-amino acid oxidase-like deaminating enzyme